MPKKQGFLSRIVSRLHAWRYGWEMVDRLNYLLYAVRFEYDMVAAELGQSTGALEALKGEIKLKEAKLEALAKDETPEGETAKTELTADVAALKDKQIRSELNIEQIRMKLQQLREDIATNEMRMAVNARR